MKFDILIRPVITEKSLKLVDEKNQYTFVVSSFSNKTDVKKAIEKKFKVNVLKVRIVSVEGGRVLWGKRRISGRKKDYKKAIVTLKSSDSIDLFKVK
ncbi:50S ribosomal protein L23 [Candidatus Dojkabacteria bacterium]|nr:50S ribosomal protein L23 [Candidatus Dojkabacteria bacterium]